MFPETETETLTVKNVGRRQSTVVPPQRPRHCHVAVPPTRVPAEQPVTLHAPFCAGETVQLALVALPQLPLLLHWNVADPLRQDAVSDRVTVVPAGVRPTPEEQLLPQDSVVFGQYGGGMHAQDRDSLARGLVDAGQAAPPQPGWMQVTSRLRVCVQLSPDRRHLPHGPQFPVCQTPSLGSLPVQPRDGRPEQLLPPQPGDGKLHVRVCVPLAPQAAAEQLLQADQPPLIGSLPVQEREDAPTQALPPQAGDG